MFKKIKPYIISILAALLVGGASAFLTRGNMDLYSQINKPPLAPPSVLFPIVWTILFTLMGISSAMIYVQRGENIGESHTSLRIYALQLIVNFFWSIIFFNMRSYLFAFIWLLLLLSLIIMMIIQFKKISRTAAYLQIPYAVWVTFAGYLNLMIYLLNR